jgi:hypothetical protein
MSHRGAALLGQWRGIENVVLVLAVELGLIHRSIGLSNQSLSIKGIGAAGIDDTLRHAWKTRRLRGLGQHPVRTIGTDAREHDGGRLLRVEPLMVSSPPDGAR